jgi:hypothetical protein
MRLLISNFNTVPRELIDSWGDDWLLLDQSTDESTIAELKSMQDDRVVFAKHVGHNLLDYIDYIISNYESLPQTLVLAKGNIVPRHIDGKAFQAAVKVGVFSLFIETSRPGRSKEPSTFRCPTSCLRLITRGTQTSRRIVTSPRMTN